MTEEPGSLDLYARHVKIQNRWVNGFFQNIRSVTIWITLAGFFLAPWIMWRERQAILFDISERKFYLFNITFWPQDFILLLLLLIASALFLFVITNLAGRIWCGYTCPQTVWTKCYMWIEYMIEGDRNKRLKRDKNPWEKATVLRRLIKHALWLLLALITAMTFIGYFYPIHKIIFFDIGVSGIFWIMFFTLATYVNAGWMREQVCLYFCPYARFQSVMLDKNSLVITYDHYRGEPRGSLKETNRSQFGSCIDCQLCVQVCPTGIDIREGLQMACIGCAACVDACDSVMDKVNFPRGLIRYDTENGLEKKKVQIIRPRLMASLVLMCAVLSILLYLLFTRVPLQVNAAHDHRNLYRMTANGAIENSYTLSIDNMSQHTESLEISIEGLEHVDYIGPKIIKLVAGESAIIPVTLTMSTRVGNRFNIPFRFHVQSTHNQRIKKISSSNFFIPQ